MRKPERSKVKEKDKEMQFGPKFHLGCMQQVLLPGVARLYEIMHEKRIKLKKRRWWTRFLNGKNSN